MAQWLNSKSANLPDHFTAVLIFQHWNKAKTYIEYMM